MANALAATRIRLDSALLSEFCRRNHITKLSLYGSVLRDDFRPDSDVDIMVEFEEGHTPGLFGLGGMLMDLQDMVGREVDLKTPGDFPPRIRDSVVATTEPLYAAR